MKNPSLVLIGAAMGAGAQLHETEQGPQVLSDWHLLEKLRQQGLNCRSFEILQASKEGTVLEQVTHFSKTLKHTIAEFCEKGDFPIVIGGDHSIAIGTWTGIASTQKQTETLGLIWVDAHMDAHTFETTPSRAIHGMPVAVLLGYGDPALLQVDPFSPTLSPENLQMIGMRSFETGEANLLASLKVNIADRKMVVEQGFAKLFHEFLAQLSSRVDRFGISIDLDAFDPTVAPGVGSPAARGLLRDEVLPALAACRQYPNFSCLEIAEYNPTRDKNFQTAQLVHDIICAIFQEN